MREIRHPIEHTGSGTRNGARRSAVAGAALGTLCSVGVVLAATQASGQKSPAATAWFTPEQAERGGVTFVTECGGCHGYNLVEVLAESRTADDFFSFISTMMPHENPGYLLLQQYADIIAFFLGELGFPAGDTELTDDREILAQITPGAAANQATK